MDWATPDEADIQAAESQKSQHTWIPRTDENSRRPKGSQSSSEAGSTRDAGEKECKARTRRTVDGPAAAVGVVGVVGGEAEEAISLSRAV